MLAKSHPVDNEEYPPGPQIANTPHSSREGAGPLSARFFCYHIRKTCRLPAGFQSKKAFPFTSR
jgi:hypothetical protein